MSRKVALDRFLNQLVYRLYGLMDKEVRIVKEAICNA